MAILSVFLSIFDHSGGGAFMQLVEGVHSISFSLKLKSSIFFRSASEPNLKMKSTVKQNLFNHKHFSPISKRRDFRSTPVKHQIPGINIGKINFLGLLSNC